MPAPYRPGRKAVQAVLPGRGYPRLAGRFGDEPAARVRRDQCYGQGTMLVLRQQEILPYRCFQSALLAFALFSRSPQDSKPSVVSAVWLDTCATKTILAYLSRRLREEAFSKAWA